MKPAPAGTIPPGEGVTSRGPSHPLHCGDGCTVTETTKKTNRKINSLLESSDLHWTVYSSLPTQSPHMSAKKKDLPAVPAAVATSAFAAVSEFFEEKRKSVYYSARHAASSPDGTSPAER